MTSKAKRTLATNASLQRDLIAWYTDDLRPRMRKSSVDAAQTCYQEQAASHSMESPLLSCSFFESPTSPNVAVLKRNGRLIFRRHDSNGKHFIRILGSFAKTSVVLLQARVSTTSTAHNVIPHELTAKLVAFQVGKF